MTRLRPFPTGAAALMLTTATWLTIAFARATTVSASRSDVPVSVTWKIASAPSQASDRKISGKAPSWQIASPKRTAPSMSKHTVRREHDGRVRDPVGGAFVDAAGDQPESRLARQRSQLLHQWARHVDGELGRRDAVFLEQGRQRHQVQLRRHDQLEPLERGPERADVPLELLERRLGVAGDARRLQPCYEERAARHRVDAMRLRPNASGRTERVRDHA